MSDKTPKRGILSSLMGLFGDDAQAEAEEQREAQAPAKAAAVEPKTNGAGAEAEQETGPGATSMGGDVVRESYEPGWYAVSTARTSRPSFVSEPWGGLPAQPAEESPAEPAQDPAAETDAAPQSLTEAWQSHPAETDAAPQPWQSPAVETEAALQLSPEEAWQARATGTPPLSVDDEPAEPSASGPAPIFTEPFALRDPTAVIDPDEAPAQEQSWYDQPHADEAATPYAVPFDESTHHPAHEEASYEPEHTAISYEPEQPEASFGYEQPETSLGYEQPEPSYEPEAPEASFDSEARSSYGSVSFEQEQSVDWSAEPTPPEARWSADTTAWAEPETEAAWSQPEAEPVAEADPVAEAEPPWAEPAPETVAEVESSWAAPEPVEEPLQTSEADEPTESEPQPELVAEVEPVMDAQPEPLVEAESEPEPEPEPVVAEAEAEDTSADVIPTPIVEDVHTEPEPLEETMPAPEPELATTPAASAAEDNAGLQSRVAPDRRAALDELVARGMTDDDVPAVAALLQDPERGIRVAALAALASRADAVDAAAIRQALLDPADEVRAGAVRLAAARSEQDVSEVFTMVAERQWPAMQQAALDSLPRAIRFSGIDADDLNEMLRAIGDMDSEPNGTERGGFTALAVAIGPDRLVPAMETDDERRIGAARLLLLEGSRDSLRALAAYARDPEPEVARLGRAAADALGPEPEEPAGPEQEPEQPMETEEQTVESFEAELGPQGEMVSGLARALGDPDESVRMRAGEALRGMDRETLIHWALVAMGSNDPTQVELGAQVAEAAKLSETAGELLARGAAVGPEDRGPFARALGSFGLSPEELVDLVNAMDSQHKPEGVRMLWHVGGRSLLPALEPMLHDSSATVRVAALEVFGESGDTQTIEVAQRVLETDSSPVVRATAISVIGRAGLDQRAQSLAQALADPDPDVRATAVEVLPAGMGRQAAELLLDALDDEDERVWQAAIRHLAAVPDRDRSIVWQAIERCPANRREHLVETLERHSAERLAMLALDHMASPDAAERTLAITLAGRAGTPECVRGIVQSLQDPAPTVRRTAASALLTLRSGESIQGLTRALSDPDVEVRVEAVRALSVIDDDNVLDPLITALKDPEMRVRDTAGEALVRWRSPAVARRLALALTNPSLRRPAGEVLARMGNSAVDPLVDILMEDDTELAGTVGHLLESLVGPDVFLTRLGSMNADERFRAVEALGAIRGERGVDGLIRALSDPVESIRVRAVGLLGEIGDERAFDAVKQTFLSDPVLEVVSAAEEALKRLQTPGAS